MYLYGEKLLIIDNGQLRMDNELSPIIHCPLSIVHCQLSIVHCQLSIVHCPLSISPMKQLLIFIRKEFYHVFRDRRTLLIMFGLPVAQILLFGFALSSEVKNLRIVISDQTKDANSRRIIDKIKASSYFITEEKTIGGNEIEKTLKKGDRQCVVIFPSGFGSDLQRFHKAQLQFIADGTDPNTAKTLVNYLNAIVAGYQKEISPPAALPYTIIPETRMLYNEESNGSLNYIPGVLALVLMIVCTALTSVAVVREKELGTMEILLVSPFKPVMVL